MRADLSKPLPYKYGFVRATAPQYLRVPSKEEQDKSEMKLDEHLAWYVDHREEVQKVIEGANDIPLDARGVAAPDLKPSDGQKRSTESSLLELFGGKTASEPPPFWLQERKRAIP